MKTAKQEAIEKAWKDIVGEDNFNRLHLDEDGFSNYSCKSYMGYSDKENLYSRIKKDKIIYRPKSLSGIETNNGWIRIESEEDLPKERYGLYHVYSKEPIFSEETYYGTDDFWQNDRQKVDEWLEMYSHYQPIQKPEPPIY